jgi:hypothetical protein
MTYNLINLYLYTYYFIIFRVYYYVLLKVYLFEFEYVYVACSNKYVLHTNYDSRVVNVRDHERLQIAFCLQQFKNRQKLTWTTSLTRILKIDCFYLKRLDIIIMKSKHSNFKIRGITVVQVNFCRFLNCCKQNAICNLS